MRLLAIAVVVLLLVPAAGAATPPPSPADVYSDFAAHGRLTHVYPRSLLQSIIDDASLNQYGDPLVMLRLRRAARLQLAGVVPTQPTTIAITTPSTAPSITTTAPGATTTRRATTPTTVAQTTKMPHPKRPPRPVVATAAAPLLSTRAIVLIALAFVLAVAALATASARARRG